MLKVRRAFSVGRKTYRQGRLVSDDDPVVAGREHLFVDIDEETDAARTIEQATAAPGERREAFLKSKAVVTKAKKKAAKKAARKAADEPAEPESSSAGEAGDPADSLTCEICDREFKNAGGLSSHQRAKH